MGRFPVNEMNVVKIILITNTSHPRAKDVTVWLLPLTDLILRETKEHMTGVVCILPSLKQSYTKTLRCPYMNYESPCWPLCGPSIAMPESWAQLRFSPHVNCKERSAGSLQKASFTIMWYRLLHPPLHNHINETKHLLPHWVTGGFTQLQVRLRLPLWVRPLYKPSSPHLCRFQRSIRIVQ